MCRTQWMVMALVLYVQGQGGECFGAQVKEYDPLSPRVLRQCLKNPYVCAFLDVVSYSEGTYGENGYNRCFTGVEFSGFTDHPRMRFKTGPFCSDAAGRYQFLSKTWDYLVKKMHFKSFIPENQDKAAVQLIYEREALDDLLQGRFDQTLKKTSGIWASLPGARYGQPVQPLSLIKKFYRERLAFWKHDLEQKQPHKRSMAS